MAVTRRAAAAAALLLVAAIAGCGGDPELWARWNAERLLWRARRLEARAAAGDPVAWQRAAAALDRVAALRHAPAGAPPAAGPRTRDVAALAGTAALLRARLDAVAGREADAERAYARVATDWAGIDSVAVAARAARAVLLERLARDREAVAEWGGLARRAASPDSAGVAPWTACRTAAAEAVRLLARLGRTAEADSLGDAASAALGAEAARMADRTIADDLWAAVAELRRRAGHYDAARAALRAALSEPGADDARAARVLELATLSREALEPDTAVRYAAWAAHEFSGDIANSAMLELAHAWEDAGVADSSLPVYKRLIEQLPSMGGLAARARLDRARLLDRTGHWEAARAELRALAMMQPTDPCGQAALVEIVRHHVREGEAVFARVESSHALETLDRLLAVQGDAALRVEALGARAEVLALMGRAAAAESVYAGAWRAYPDLPAAAFAGWRAARVADSLLHDPRDAAALYRDLAARSADPDIRWRARQRLAADATPARGTPAAGGSR